MWSGGRSGFNLSFTEKIKTTTVLHASLIQLLLQLYIENACQPLIAFTRVIWIAVSVDFYDLGLL